MAVEFKVNGKVFKKITVAMEKSEIIHPSDREKETSNFFKCLKLQDQEERVQDRGFGDPVIATSPEFALHGVPAALREKKLQAEASATEEYDPNKVERTSGCCMRTFLCLCFCSC
jgi:hypothetical protein